MNTSKLKKEINIDISKLVPAGSPIKDPRLEPSRASFGGKIKQGKEVVIDKGNLPLNIVYKGKRYILILTKNDKLILNKNTD